MSLDAVREAIDTYAGAEPAVFARRTRNALAAAILAEACSRSAPPSASHSAPAMELRATVGDDLADTLAAIYEGDEDWTSRAIEALEPLHAIARG